MNVRTNMGTDYTVIVVEDSTGVEVDFASGSLVNPGDVANLAAILEKWEDDDTVTVDLSID